METIYFSGRSIIVGLRKWIFQRGTFIITTEDIAGKRVECALFGLHERIFKIAGEF